MTTMRDLATAAATPDEQGTPVHQARVQGTGRRLMGLAEIAAYFGVSKQRVGELTERRCFPATVCSQIGQPELRGGKIYYQDEIEHWYEQWDRRPGRPRRTTS